MQLCTDQQITAYVAAPPRQPRVDRAIGLVRHKAALHDADLGGLRVELLDLQRKLSRPPGVVGIEEGDEPTTRLGQSAIACLGHAGILRLTQVADAIVAEAAKHVGRVVGRAVVDHEQLEVAERLGEQAADRAGQQVRAVVRRHHDRHLGPRELDDTCRPRIARRHIEPAIVPVRWRLRGRGRGRRFVVFQLATKPSHRRTSKGSSAIERCRRDVRGDRHRVAGEQVVRLSHGQRVGVDAADVFQAAVNFSQRVEPVRQPVGPQADAAERGLLRQASVERAAATCLAERHAVDESTHHQVAVVVDGRTLVPTAETFDNATRPEHRARRGVPAAKPVVERRARRTRSTRRGRRRPLPVDLFETPPRTDRHTVRRQDVEQRRNRIGPEDVVGVEEEEAVVACRGGAAIPLGEHRYSLVRGRE